MLQGARDFSSYTVFQKPGSEVDYRPIHKQTALDPEVEREVLRQVYALVRASSAQFGPGSSIEWGFCQNKTVVFQIRNIRFQPEPANVSRGITSFPVSEQGFKFQAMQYFHEHGLFPAKALFFDSHTGMEQIRNRMGTIDGTKPVTVRFSVKNQIGLPRYFDKNCEDALGYLEENLRDEWAVILYNSIHVRASFELYLDAQQLILEHVPGMWESDSILYADAVCQTETQTDFWLAKNVRMARFEDEDGNIWQQVPPLGRAKAVGLLEAVAPIAAQLRKDFAADLPLNFHFVGDGARFYFLNCRLSAKIRSGIGMTGKLHRIASLGDIEDWDGVSSILFEPSLARGEEIFLVEFIPFLKQAKVPVYVSFGILSHPAIMLREFGIEPQPLYSCHNHFVERKGKL